MLLRTDVYQSTFAPPAYNLIWCLVSAATLVWGASYLTPGRGYSSWEYVKGCINAKRCMVVVSAIRGTSRTKTVSLSYIHNGSMPTLISRVVTRAGILQAGGARRPNNTMKGLSQKHPITIPLWTLRILVNEFT